MTKINPKFDVEKLDEPSPYTKLYNDRSSILTCKDKKEILSKDYDIVIVGGGPIGSVMATAFARDGRKVLVVERSWDKPDRIVGELMQPGGIEALENLGLGDVFNGISAVPTSGYYIGFKQDSVYVPYNVNPDTGKRIKGVSFHHGNFLSTVRSACKAEPNVTCLEAEVSELIKNEDENKVLGVRIIPKRGFKDQEAYHAEDDTVKLDKDQTGFSVYAPLTVVADGIYSKFRTENLPSRKPVLKSHFVGFVIEHNQENPLPCPRNGHVFLNGFTPILMYQMSDTETRVLVDVPGTKLPNQSNGSLRKYIEAAGSSLPDGIREAYQENLDKSKRLRVMTNSYFPPKKTRIMGAVFVGDSYNMRHPLTGGGMTVGYWDCVYLIRNLSKAKIPDLSDSEAISEALEEVYTLRRPRALVINTLSVALYSLFSADSEPYRNLRDACFQYFTLGGDAIAGPSGLLSGTITNPLVLAYHFFSVALYAMFLEVCKSTSVISMFPHFLKAVYTLLVAAYIFVPLIINEILS
ncbi:hypothetical protein BB559_000501 [Furculomyces boomerangus]|uniref:Squalene monooxygenase n=2 Tax=Harpellales TaxID=61421 RepID=A0A2T9Z519_9FUNG|nr:hypothetical protein BB559_000501 [Furculomyces boomerangus]PVZ97502.1 hypothetical protein BB558_006544 [Smittium angustum]